MAERQKHISIKYYQDVIIKEFAFRTQRNQKVYYQMALDEFIINHHKEILEQGINSNFLIEKSKEQHGLLEEIPGKLKQLYGLK